MSKTTVGKWRRGKVTPYRVRQLEQLLRPDLQIKEAAPPYWAERLLVVSEAARQKAGVTDSELAKAEADLVVLQLLGPNAGKRRTGNGGAAGGSGSAK